MAIRLRVVDGETVALCAAQTVSVEGDVYLDDNMHYALMLKFAGDFHESGVCPDIGISEARNRRLVKSQEDSSACKERDEWLLGPDRQG